ncbi:putative HTH-type transcriptional regulator y4mF [Alphaproteobacteria bacterium]|nr:putative HTH-type transcriptional regulator y4mF [Alphaproteobacteria bacterium]
MDKMIRTVKDLGIIIRNRRKEMKLSQVELAGLCGVGNRFIVDLEAGKPTIQFDKALYVAKNVGLEIQATQKGRDDK